MIVQRSISDAQLIAIIEAWVELLAHQKYAEAAVESGYALAIGDDPAECIRKAIESFRSAQLYPDVEEFRVTSPADAAGGTEPLSTVIRYEANEIGLWGAVDYSLPLNGKWSSLVANFVLFESRDGSGNLLLSLEDISST